MNKRAGTQTTEMNEGALSMCPTLVSEICFWVKVSHVHVVVGPLREVGQEVGTLIEGRQGLHGIQWDLVCVLAATIRTHGLPQGTLQRKGRVPTGLSKPKRLDWESTVIVPTQKETRR